MRISVDLLRADSDDDLSYDLIVPNEVEDQVVVLSVEPINYFDHTYIYQFFQL